MENKTEDKIEGKAKEKMEDSLDEHYNRLQFFPVMMFAIIMGLSGLAIVYQKAHEWLGFPKEISMFFIAIDTILFFLILLTYSIKTLKYFEEVKKEFNHPIRINFFAAASISLLLLSIIYNEEKMFVGTIFWCAGVVIHSFLTFYTLSFWINRNFEITHSNPAWFIPIVGNVLVPVGGAGIVSNEFLMFYFSVGIFFWIILLAVIINRIIFHHQLAQKFMPTLFIFIAPPAIGCIAYVKMFDKFDLMATAFYDIGLFFTLLLLFMYKNFLKMKFFISWWAFTFPMAAITIASMVAHKKTGIIFYGYFSYIFMTITTAIVLVVAYQTILNMRKKEICVAE